jgi:hypothetical protein
MTLAGKNFIESHPVRTAIIMGTLWGALMTLFWWIQGKPLDAIYFGVLALCSLAFGLMWSFWMKRRFEKARRS